MGDLVEVEITGLDPIVTGMESNAPEKAIKDNLTNTILKIETKAKQSTVVDTGRLRASITHSISDTFASVGTNVEYAPFIEYGHLSRGQSFVPPRHMEGATKVLGSGMMAHTVKTIQPEIKDYELRVVSQVEKEAIGQ
jgi:phage gpG-like protein